MGKETRLLRWLKRKIVSLKCPVCGSRLHERQFQVYRCTECGYVTSEREIQAVHNATTARTS